MSKSFSVSLATTNYAYSNGEIENLSTVRLSIPLWKGGTVSTDIGADLNIGRDGSIDPKFAFEGKYKQKFGNNFRGYVRYRHIGEMDQLRIAAGASVPLSDNISLYGDAHYTTKFVEGKDKFGAWVGTDIKLDKHFSVWFEGQKNFNTCNPTFNDFNNGNYSLNAGLTYKF